MKSAEETLQREALPEKEEEKVVQPQALAATPIQRMCAECEREQQGTATLQPKLTVGQPNDQYEQEADRVADQVVNQLQPSNASSVQPKLEGDRPRITPLVMRQGEGSAAISPQVDQGIQRTRGGGEAISHPIRRSMEQALGADFSGVRIHANSEADQLNRSLHAQAFTTGRDIYFKHGEYQPETKGGQRLLAHELTHVLHQNASIGLVQRFTTQDCDPADVTRINASHNRAIAMLNKAIARLTASPVTANTQRHFANHFGGYGSWRRDVVVGHFRRDLSLMTASDMTYECESECDPGEPAYTYWIFGDIHICLPWLRSETLNERGESFIHELHHWDAGRGHLDLGYHRNNTDNNTTWIVAVNNADAYSELAQDLFEQP